MPWLIQTRTEMKKSLSFAQKTTSWMPNWRTLPSHSFQDTPRKRLLRVSCEMLCPIPHPLRRSLAQILSRTWKWRFRRCDPQIHVVNGWTGPPPAVVATQYRTQILRGSPVRARGRLLNSVTPSITAHDYRPNWLGLRFDWLRISGFWLDVVLLMFCWFQARRMILNLFVKIEEELQKLTLIMVRFYDILVYI